MLRAAFNTMTRHNRGNSSDLGTEWQAYKRVRRTQNTEGDYFSKFSYVGLEEIRNLKTSSPRRNQKFQLIFRLANIHTGRYVKCTRQEAEGP
jgi:hypothetical protein